MADDLGWGDVGYNGHAVIRTPHLDAMSRSGLRFDRFYAAAPVCSPTRGSCLTGRHPYRYGIRTANDGHLRADELTLAKLLRGVGYRTGHFGKWHLGTLTPDFSGKGPGRRPAQNFMTPAAAGFDQWFSTEYAVATWDPYDPENAHGRADVRALYWHNGNNVTTADQPGLVGCDSRIIMDHVLPFVEQAVTSGVPFFVVIWFHAPHAPVIGGPAYRARYAEQADERQHYYAAVTALDEQIGRLRARLREWNAAENTMVWFCSDNGPEGTPGPAGRSQGDAGPFRGRKRSLYEGGVRVPGILEWPARLKTPRATDYPAVTSDYLPTICDVLGIELPEAEGQPVDGVSLVPLLAGEATQRPRPIGYQTRGMAAWTDNQFKLVHHERPQRDRSDNGTTPVATWELYDLLADPAESRNIARQHPDVVARMRRQLIEWQADCEADRADIQ